MRAVFESMSLWSPKKELTPVVWDGFSKTQGPTMVENGTEGIHFKLEFDKPIKTDYVVLVHVIGKTVKHGLVIEQTSDYVTVTGGHVSGMKESQIMVVEVFSG